MNNLDKELEGILKDMLLKENRLKIAIKNSENHKEVMRNCEERNKNIDKAVSQLKSLAKREAKECVPVRPEWDSTVEIFLKRLDQKFK